MAKKLNLTQYPYFDDYDNSKKYYQILFRPGRAVQARELTQIQTLLQTQVERIGSHIFKQGSNVIPGTENTIRYTKTVDFIKLPIRSVYPEYFAGTSTPEEIDAAIQTGWVGKKISVLSGERSGISGTIKGYRGPDQLGLAGEVRFFLNMETSTDDGTSASFKPGDLVSVVGTSGFSLNRSATIPSTEGTYNVGRCSSAIVQEGVYYYNGYFVYVDAQTIYLSPVPGSDADTIEYQSKWNDSPTASVGLLMSEKIITSQSDYSILDNATGTPNFSAPGADRFSIGAELVQIKYDQSDAKPENYINLLDVKEGRIYNISDAPEYAIIADTLARRTHDESGDYVVENMAIEVKEFLLDEELQINGAHQLSEFQFTTLAAAQEYSAEKFGINSAIQYPTTSGQNSFFYPGTSYANRNDPTSFKKLCESYVTIRVDSGKAYVKGYEIRKLARTSVDVPKSRTTTYVNGAVVATEIGSYLSVRDVSGNVNIGNLTSVVLYNTRRIGTKKANTGTTVSNNYIPAEFTYATTEPNSSAKIGTATAVKIETNEQLGPGFYKIYITDIHFLSGYSAENIRAVYSVGGDGFIAHTVLSEFNLTGSISKPAGLGTYEFIGLGTQWKNFPGEILKVGGYVLLKGNTAGQQQYYKIKSISSDTKIELESEELNVAPGVIESTTLKGLFSKIDSSTNENGLIYRLGENYVSTIRSADMTGSPDTGVSGMTYTIEELFTQPNGSGITPTNNTIVISTIHEFDSNIYTHKVVKKNAGVKTTLLVASGATSPSSSGTCNISISGNNTTLTLYFHANDVSGSSEFFIMVPVVKSGLIEKKKHLRYGTFEPDTKKYTNTGDVFPVTGKGVKVVTSTNNSDIQLDECDVFQVTRIVASKNSNTAPTDTSVLNEGDVDVTALYEFNDGQKEYYYDFGRVTIRPGYAKPIGQVRVEYDYFDHVSGSDYISVDSYVHANGISYDQIPKFISGTGAEYALADCVDFRKKISEVTSGRAPLDSFICNFFQYNSRLDKIVLDSKSKTFRLVEGVPGSDPVSPDDTEFGMTLSEIRLLPYGIGKQSCVLKPVDNRRYTMRDIGKIEKRVENLEYYTSLSLLEAETSSAAILDANGNNRYKNGFLVDSFESFESSDISSGDFSCSIDTKIDHVARPLIYTDNFLLEEDLSNPIFAGRVNELRSTNGYTKTGDIYYLPYTRTEFISQNIATRIINVNPYAVFTYIGHVVLKPWSDAWRETRYSEKIIYDDSAYRTAMALHNGVIDYGRETSHNTTIQGTKKKARKESLLAAGHLFYDRMSAKERAEADKRKLFRVPAPYANQGDMVSIDPRGKTKTAYGTTQVTTTTTTTIREAFQRSVAAGAISTSTAITSNTSTIEYMRTREVVFSGTGFRGNTNLYTFFDGRPVSKYCRPTGTTDITNFAEYSVIDATSETGELNILPVDSPIRVFKGTFPTVTTSAGPGVRVGCEVLFTSSRGILRKFDIISASATHIVCEEKTGEGLLSSQASGSISEAADNSAVVKISRYTYGDQLKSDGTGTVGGVFVIPSPNTSSIAHLFSGNATDIGFKTGQTQFVITASNINASTSSSIGSANFESTGTLVTQSATITQTQGFVMSTTQLPSEISETSADSTVFGFTPPRFIDPIAQSFTINENGGCFITDVELFFRSKDLAVPVRLELCTVSLTGYPERQIVGGRLGTVIKHSKDVVLNVVNAANKTLSIEVDTDAIPTNIGALVDYAGGTPRLTWSTTTPVRTDKLKQKNSTSATIIANSTVPGSTDMASDMIPTRFTFDSPIFLEEGKQYAFVVMTDSTSYEVWAAQKGPYGPIDKNVEYNYYARADLTNLKIGTADSIDNNVLYTEGNFFKSSNGTAWIPDHTMTMKFNIGKAKFKTKEITADNTQQNIGKIEYVNETLGWVSLQSGALEVRPSSNLIRVLYPNHGISVGERVRFIVDLPSTDLRGFTQEQLQHMEGLLVVNAELDYFTVSVTGGAASSVLAKEHYTMGNHRLTTGGTVSVPTVKIRANKRFDQLTIVENSFCPPGTSIMWTLQTTPGVGVNEYNQTGTGGLVSRNSGSKLPAITISTKTPVEFSSPMIIKCSDNEPENDLQTQGHIQEIKSIITSAILISTNENLSPVLDQSRLSVTTLANRLSNVSGTASSYSNNINNSVFDTLTIFSMNSVPSDVVLIDGTPTSVARSPSTGAQSILSNLSFSTTTKLLSGTFISQSTGSILIGSGSSLISEVNVGDIITAANQTATEDQRIVVEVISNTQIKLNAPFNPPLPVRTVLSLLGEKMEITTEDASVASHLSQLDSGKYITVKIYASNGELVTDDTRACENVLILGVDYTPTDTVKCKITVNTLNTRLSPPTGAAKVTISQLDRYIDEIGYKGNSGSTRYITKKLNLDKTSNALKISFDGIRDPSSHLDLYYRTEFPSDIVTIEDKPWKKATYNTVVDGVITPKTPSPDGLKFQSYESSVDGLQGFKGIQAKVVMRGGNSAAPPMIKNFKLIALDE